MAKSYNREFQKLTKEAGRIGIRTYSPSYAPKWVRKQLAQMPTETRQEFEAQAKSAKLTRKEQALFLQAIDKYNSVQDKVQEQARKNVKDMSGMPLPKGVESNLTANMYFGKMKTPRSLPPTKEAAYKEMQRLIDHGTVRKYKIRRNEIMQAGVASAIRAAWDDERLAQRVEQLSEKEFFIFATQYQGNMISYIYDANINQEVGMRKQNIEMWLNIATKDRSLF